MTFNSSTRPTATEAGATVAPSSEQRVPDSKNQPASDPKSSILLPKEYQQKHELLPIQIIATDFDGTIMGDQLEVPRSTMDIYREIEHDPRIRVILATGRNLGGVRLALEESVAARGFHMSFFPGIYLNGSVIYGPGGESDLLANHSLEQENVLKIIELVHRLTTGTGPVELGSTASTLSWKDSGLQDVGLQDSLSVGVNHGESNSQPDSSASKTGRFSPHLAQLIRDSAGMAAVSPTAGLPLVEQTPLTLVLLTKDLLCFDSINELVANYAVLKVGPLNYVPSLAEFVRESHDPVNLMLLLAESEGVIDKVEPCVHELLGNYHDVGRLAPRALYISPRNVNKGSAIEALGKRLGVPMSDILGIGDADNDLEMLRMCGVGVAMGNGRDAVKKAADIVTDRLESGGWAKAIAVATSATQLQERLFRSMEKQRPIFTAFGPRFRMIATDIDGTVFAAGLSLPRTTVLALRRASRLGVSVVPATGRSYPGVAGVLNLLGYKYPEHHLAEETASYDDDEELSTPLRLWPGIYLNGCVVLGPKGPNDIVTEHLLPPEVVVRLADTVDEIERLVTQDPQWQDLEEVIGAEKSHGFGPVCNFRLKASYMTLACYSYGNVLVSEKTQLSDGSTQFRDGILEEVGDLRHVVATRPVHKAIIFAHSAASINRFRSKIEESLRGFSIALVSALPRSLEIMPPGISKATGLLELSKRLGCPLNSIVSLGDSDNDIEMLRASGLSVAMGNSSEAVTQAAQVTTAKVGKQGWATAVNAVLDQIELTADSRSSCSTVPTPSNPTTFGESP